MNNRMVLGPTWDLLGLFGRIYIWVMLYIYLGIEIENNVKIYQLKCSFDTNQL